MNEGRKLINNKDKSKLEIATRKKVMQPEIDVICPYCETKFHTIAVVNLVPYHYLQEYFDYRTKLGEKTKNE